MIARPRRIVRLILGLVFGVGCGVPFPRIHPDGANNGDRKEAGIEAVATDAETAEPADAARSFDIDSDSEPSDSEAGLILDSLLSGDGRDSMRESADAEADVPALDVSWPVDRGSDGEPRDDGAGLGVDGVTSCSSSSWILVGAVPNARQLGGIPLVGGGVVACDSIYRGSSLASLPSDRCGQFASMGIKTLIDLRSVDEQTSVPASCVTQHTSLVSAPLPIPYSVSPADYLAILYTAPSMRTVFAVLADRTAYPVYYYCLYGKDRTGVLTALILTALGASRQTIQDEYALSDEAGMISAPKSLEAVLDEIDRIGGIDAYFRVVGVPAEQVRALRANLVLNPQKASADRR
jgi:hypothetical protein